MNQQYNNRLFIAIKSRMENKGKIYWVEDDFSYTGLRLLMGEETHAVARIENGIIEDHMIMLTTEPTDFGQGVNSYNINLCQMIKVKSLKAIIL
jgi:hypothetical protein